MKKKNKVLALLIAVTLVAGLLAGCSGGTGSGEITTGPESATEPQPTTQPQTGQTDPGGDDKYGGIASFVIQSDPQNINYRASQGGNIDVQIMMATSDMLCVYDPITGEYEPRLLESWEMSEDGTVWTMKVREGVYWHDGVEFTAEDVVFYYNYMNSPDLDTLKDSTYVASNETWELVDKYTYKVITEEPNPAELADWTWILPKHIWENVPPSNFSKAAEGRLMIGCGPFKMTEYKVGEYIRFDRFDDYWGGKPYLDTIYYRIIGDTSSAIAALESGQVDCVTVDATSAETVVSNPDINIWQGSSGNVNRLYFNLEDPRFEDVRVRRAIAHLMQKDVFVQQAMRGFADVANSDFAPTDFYYVADPYAQYDFNVEKAKALMEEAGFTLNSEGVYQKGDVVMEFEIYYTSGASQAAAAILIMTPTFAEAGIKITPYLPDDATMADLWDTHDYIMLNSGTTMGPDPVRYQYIFAVPAPNNIMLYEEPAVKELFDQAAAALNDHERRALYEQIQYALASDVPNIPLWYRHTIYAHSDQLVIEDAAPVGYVHFRFLHMENLYLKK